MSSKSKEILRIIKNGKFSHNLKDSLHGLEREGIRVNEKGEMSKKMHPCALGSALTNPYISTDFSESQLELITPTFRTEQGAIDFLRETESRVQKNLDGEYIWSPSMPSILPDKESDIPLAQFGNSKEGKKKTLYREGLGHRYGRRMQTISGIHYNFSFSQGFWKELHKKLGVKDSLQDFITDAYMRIMRNFLRVSWLDIYLFGSSPAIDKSYIKSPKTPLKKHGKRTLYAPFSTSLRMSQFGYCCSVQAEMSVSHNSLKEYVADLQKAIKSPYEKYKKFGKKQMNSNYLQISNEYYSPIRAKQGVKLGEDILGKLLRKGIKYLEVRSGDLDPFSACGVDIEQMYFFHILMIYLLTQPAPKLTSDEQKNCAKNHNKTALYGRRKGVKLTRKGKEIELKKWGLREVRAMLPIAKLLDSVHKTTRYTQNLHHQIQKLENPNITPSAVILSILKKNKIEFADFGIQRTKENSKFYEAIKIHKKTEDKFIQAAKTSFKEKDLLE